MAGPDQISLNDRQKIKDIFAAFKERFTERQVEQMYLACEKDFDATIDMLLENRPLPPQPMDEYCMV